MRDLSPEFCAWSRGLHAGGGGKNLLATRHAIHPRKFVPTFPRYDEVSAAMESSARFVAVLLLCHLLRLNSAKTVFEPINTYAVVGVGVFRDLEHVVRSAVMKFHGQRIRREDVVGDVTAPLSGDVFICGRVGNACRQYPTRK
jgi:hypothetical protein